MFLEGLQCGCNSYLNRYGIFYMDTRSVWALFNVSPFYISERFFMNLTKIPILLPNGLIKGGRRVGP